MFTLSVLPCRFCWLPHQTWPSYHTTCVAIALTQTARWVTCATGAMQLCSCVGCQSPPAGLPKVCTCTPLRSMYKHIGQQAVDDDDADPALLLVVLPQVPLEFPDDPLPDVPMDCPSCQRAVCSTCRSKWHSGLVSSHPAWAVQQLAVSVCAYYWPYVVFCTSALPCFQPAPLFE